MAYLKNENGEIIVDAILTDYGRSKLANGIPLGISQFSVADDEVDYSLYNTSNPFGEEYYDIAIRELPVLEALAKSTSNMRYKLYTDSTTSNVSISKVAVGAISLKLSVYTFSPILSDSIQTPNYYVVGIKSTTIEGIKNIELKSTTVAVPNSILSNARDNIREYYDGTNTDAIAIGNTFTLQYIRTSLPTIPQTYLMRIATDNLVMSIPLTFNITTGVWCY